MANTKTIKKTKPEELAEAWLKSSFMANVFHAGRTLKRVSLVIAPTVIGLYLAVNFDDTIVLAIAVALLSFAVVTLVNSAYLAEAKKRR